jgi:nucleoside-diphosphate-sugar epimerase
LACPKKETVVNIFVAGVSGALGMPIVTELLRLGHRVTAMTRSKSGSERLAAFGAAVERINAFDSTAVMEASRVNMVSERVRAELLRRIGLGVLLTPRDLAVELQSAASRRT